mgnify:CR=1 FL=1
MLFTIFMYGCTTYVLVKTLLAGLSASFKLLEQAKLENGGKVGFTESIFVTCVGLLMPVVYLLFIIAVGAIVYYFPFFIGVL